MAGGKRKQRGGGGNRKNDGTSSRGSGGKLPVTISKKPHKRQRTDETNKHPSRGNRLGATPTAQEFPCPHTSRTQESSRLLCLLRQPTPAAAVHQVKRPGAMDHPQAAASH
jgi:hypothetical protein